MSIFGGQDVNLPIITQLMQVDVENPLTFSAEITDEGLIPVLEDTELRRFWYQCYAYAHAELIWDLDSTTYDWHKEFRDALSSANGVLKTFESFHKGIGDHGEPPLVAFKKVCLDLQEVFNSLFYDDSVPIRKIRKIRELTKPFHIVMDYVDPDEDPEQVLFFQLTPVYTEQFRDPLKFLAWSMDTLLLDIWRGGKRLKGCEECKSIYVAEKERSRFCSVRCKARVGQRRRRRLAEEKEMLLESVAFSER